MDDAKQWIVARPFSISARPATTDAPYSHSPPSLTSPLPLRPINLTMTPVDWINSIIGRPNNFHSYRNTKQNCERGELARCDLSGARRAPETEVLHEEG
ncbi:hypothetical protein GWI33_011483 [Rhynchophorus ferrugineus]|uniref:Uncharacterized protein n=1 Tax=Rhynchophorus ferrugineus TaxID=354439 RepID=A0A834IBJ7_RHYFE|nr:hypothetical protein GWI33_011483 [Rhynchophorus ferrugineus]